MKKKYYFKVKNVEKFQPPLPHADISKPEIRKMVGEIEMSEKEYEEFKDRTSLVISYNSLPDFWGELLDVAQVEGDWEVYVLVENN